MTAPSNDTTGRDLLEVMLHPIRLRALAALSRGELTTGELAARLDGVAASSLYRHMKALRDAGLVTFTERRPNRGATERIYALARSAHLDAEDVAGMSGEDHAQLFTTWALTLVDRFASYATPQPTLDVAAERVGYVETPFYASDDEFDAELAVIRGALARLHALEPSPERRERVFVTITHPTSSPQHEE